MNYNEALSIIKEETKNLKIELVSNTNNIFPRYNQNYYYGNILSHLIQKITKRLTTPWLSKEELNKIYKGEKIDIYKSSRGRTYYKCNKYKIYSSVQPGKLYIDGNNILYIYLDLLYTKNEYINSDIDIENYYNPHILIKLDLSDLTILFKLLSGSDFKKIRKYNEDIYENSINRIIINESEL